MTGLSQTYKPRSIHYDIDMSSNVLTSSIDVSAYKNGSAQFVWTGFNGTNAKAHFQWSEDGTNWEDWGGNEGAGTINEAASHQGFEFIDITFNYLRFEFLKGNGTAGTGDLEIRLRQ